MSHLPLNHRPQSLDEVVTIVWRMKRHIADSVTGQPLYIVSRDDDEDPANYENPPAPIDKLFVKFLAESKKERPRFKLIDKKILELEGIYQEAWHAERLFCWELWFASDFAASDPRVWHVCESSDAAAVRRCHLNLLFTSPKKGEHDHLSPASLAASMNSQFQSNVGDPFHQQPYLRMWEYRYGENCRQAIVLALQLMAHQRRWCTTVGFCDDVE